MQTGVHSLQRGRIVVQISVGNILNVKVTAECAADGVVELLKLKTGNVNAWVTTWGPTNKSRKFEGVYSFGIDGNRLVWLGWQGGCGFGRRRLFGLGGFV